MIFIYKDTKHLLDCRLFAHCFKTFLSRTGVDYWMVNEELPTGNYYYKLMLACYDNGELIFTRNDFFSEPDVNGITLTPMAMSVDTRMYDTLGRHVENPKKGQMYITKEEKRIKQ